MKDQIGRWWPLAAGAVLAAVAAAALPPAAGAQYVLPRPQVLAPPVVEGTPGVGGVLRATGARWDPAQAIPSWRWQRCTPVACKGIRGATDTTYRVTRRDVGRTLRVRLVVTLQGAASDPAYSGPTSAIPAPQLRFITPFPVVRISGNYTSRWTDFTRVSVQAPKAARVRYRCRGRGCPRGTRAFTSRVVRLRRLQRRLYPGVRFDIQVTQRGRVGKATTVRVRAGKAPARRDRCLLPGSSRPVRCPAG